MISLYVLICFSTYPERNFRKKKEGGEIVLYQSDEVVNFWRAKFDDPHSQKFTLATIAQDNKRTNNFQLAIFINAGYYFFFFLRVAVVKRKRLISLYFGHLHYNSTALSRPCFLRLDALHATNVGRLLFWRWRRERKKKKKRPSVVRVIISHLFHVFDALIGFTRLGKHTYKMKPSNRFWLQSRSFSHSIISILYYEVL